VNCTVDMECVVISYTYDHGVTQRVASHDHVLDTSHEGSEDRSNTRHLTHMRARSKFFCINRKSPHVSRWDSKFGRTGLFDKH
jgi:hypothetical protein